MKSFTVTIRLPNHTTEEVFIQAADRNKAMKLAELQNPNCKALSCMENR